VSPEKAFTGLKSTLPGDNSDSSQKAVGHVLTRLTKEIILSGDDIKSRIMI
jgi:hypothetical protein